MPRPPCQESDQNIGLSRLVGSALQPGEEEEASVPICLVLLLQHEVLRPTKEKASLIY